MKRLMVFGMGLMVVLALGWGGIVTAANEQEPGAEEKPEKKEKTRVELVQGSYENFPAEIISMVEPIKITNSGMLRDGGSVFIEIEDAEESTLLVCIDNRLGVDGEKLMYFGTKYPAGRGSLPVFIRSPESAAVYGLLLRWRKGNPLPKEVKDWGKVDPQLRMGHGWVDILTRRFDERPR